LGPLPAQAAQPSSDNNERAKQLYREGEKAYRVGKFKDAVAKFEEAYELSGLPAILYNIGLAYTRAYDVTNDVGDLRQAIAILQNFYIEIQKDPELGDLEEIEGQLAELREKLSTAEEAEKERQAEERKRQEELAKQQRENDRKNDRRQVPEGDDPGKKLRLGGIGAMAGGGALFATGAVFFSFYLIKGQQFSEELTNIRREQEEKDCGGSMPEPECTDQSDGMGGIVKGLDGREQTTINNGRLANNLSIFVGGSLAIVGIAGVVAGAVVYARGDKKTKAWKKGEIVLAPTPGGLVLSGKF
jgi:tetratricopeptide (TPR) repeat protein